MQPAVGSTIESTGTGCSTAAMTSERRADETQVVTGCARGPDKGSRLGLGTLGAAHSPDKTFPSRSGSGGRAPSRSGFFALYHPSEPSPAQPEQNLPRENPWRIQPYSHTRHTSYSAIQPPSALYLAPAAPLPPSLPRASQLAARALDGQIELVARAVGAVRVGVPLSPPAPCSRRAGPSPSGGAPWRGRVRGGSAKSRCMHAYTVFSRVCSHGSHTRIIQVHTYVTYVCLL